MDILGAECNQKFDLEKFKLNYRCVLFFSITPLAFFFSFSVLAEVEDNGQFPTWP